MDRHEAKIRLRADLAKAFDYSGLGGHLSSVNMVAERLYTDGYTPPVPDAERRERIKQEIHEAWNEPHMNQMPIGRDTFGMFLDRAADRVLRLQPTPPEIPERSSACFDCPVLKIDRHEFLKLSVVERRKILFKQAEILASLSKDSDNYADKGMME